jgi:hypothetical protein
MDNETPLRLAYDASVRAIGDQSGVLEGLRGRAGTLFAAAALVTSFLGGQSLRATTHLVVASYAGVAVGCFVLAAFLTLIILWPFRLAFSLSAGEFIAIVDERAAEGEPVTGDEAYRELAIRMELNYDLNSRTIRGLYWCFRIAIVCLVGEISAWIVVLWRA